MGYTNLDIVHDLGEALGSINGAYIIIQRIRKDMKRGKYDSDFDNPNFGDDPNAAFEALLNALDEAEEAYSDFAGPISDSIRDIGTNFG